MANEQYFICHSTGDAVLASQIARVVEEAGLRAWIAPRDIPPGRPSFGQELVAAIRGSDVLLLVGTEGAYASRHVEREVVLADNAGLEILAVLVDGMPRGALEYHLSTPQCLVTTRDAVLGDLRTHLARVRPHNGSPVAPRGDPPDVGAAADAVVADLVRNTYGDADATVALAQAMARGVLRRVAAGADLAGIRRGVDVAVGAVIDALASHSSPVTSKEQLAAVVSIAAADTTVGAVVAEVIDRVGLLGAVAVEASTTAGDEIEVSDGCQFDGGYLSPDFITDPERGEVVLEHPQVLVVEGAVDDVSVLLHLLERVVGSARPLLIVADDVAGSALETLVLNKRRGVLASVAVKAPTSTRGDNGSLVDIAILTGGELVPVDGDRGLSHAGVDVLGEAQRVVVTKDSTTIIEAQGHPDEIAALIERLGGELSRAESPETRAELQRRLGKVAGGVAIVRVGAATEALRAERMGRIERAVRIARAAVEEGLLNDGRRDLLRAAAAAADSYEVAELVADEAVGARLVLAAMTSQHPALLALGAIHTVKDTRIALVRAASVAGLFLTTHAR